MFFAALVTSTLAAAPTTSTVSLRKTVDTGTFARYQPFDDPREVIVRRGKELGFDYGLELSRRTVKVRGGEFLMVRRQTFLSPPPAVEPWRKPPPPQKTAANLKPISDLLMLPDAEVLIRREPDGFTDEEVATILAAISVK